MFKVTRYKKDDAMPRSALLDRLDLRQRKNDELRRVMAGGWEQEVETIDEPRPKPSTTSALKDVMALVDGFEARDKRPTEEIDTTIALLWKRREGLFLIEKEAQAKIDSEIKTLRCERAASHYLGNTTYIPISEEVLKWRDDKGHPRLVLYPMNDPVFTLPGDQSRRNTVTVATGTTSTITAAHMEAQAAVPSGTIEFNEGRQSITVRELINMRDKKYEAKKKKKKVKKPKKVVWKDEAKSTPVEKPIEYQPVPDALMENYLDVVKEMYDEASKAERNHGHHIGRTNYYIKQLRAEFKGLIPDSTRTKIKAAAKEFGGHIYLLAEPDFETKIIDIDPIVIGYDVTGNSMWYIDDFDLSPVEEAALLVGPNNK